MRLFSYLTGTKLRVAGAGIIAVAIFSFLTLFPFNSVQAAGSTFDKETDPTTIFKTIKYYQGIKACSEAGKFKTTVSGDDIDKGPRWWIDAGASRMTLGTYIDKWGDKNGLTTCAGESDDQPGWIEDAFQTYGFDPDGGEATLKKMGYTCSTVNNTRECKKGDINGTILGKVKDTPYLKGTSIGDTNGQLYKVATYWGALGALQQSCGAKVGGSSNIYSLSTVQTNGTIKKQDWTIPTSGTIYAGIDPITDMGSSNTDSCRSTLVNAVNDNADDFQIWQSKSICASTYPQLTSDMALASCAAGRANATNATYCMGVTFKNACFLGAGNPTDANGKTAGELCMESYGTDAGLVGACINGAVNRANPSYCSSTYPAPDSLNSSGQPLADTNKAKRDACTHGATKLAVAGGGAVLSESGTPEDPNKDTTATSCIVDGIGWMVCPLLNALGGLGDAMYGWIDSVLRLQPLTATNAAGGESAQFTAWRNIRNLANVVLVIGFIIIIFSQLTSMGMSNYGVKKTLPRLIIVAIAINTSFYIMAIAVDITNIAGVGIHQIFSTLAPDASSATMNAAEIIGAFVTGAGAVAVAGTVVTIAATAGGLSLGVLGLMALPVIAVVVLALLAAVATLFIRNALIVVLIVIAPLAIAAYLLPNTQNLFTKWRKLFVSMLVLFPMAALLFAGAKFAASVVVVSDQPLSALAAIFIMAAPLGMLPWLIKSSNSLLGNIGGKLMGMAQKVRNPIKGATAGQIEKQKAAYQAGRRNFFGARQAEGRTNMAQRWSNRRMSRNAETENLKGEAQENWREMAVDGSTKAGQRAAHALDEQQTHHTRKAANDSTFKVRSDRRKATAGTADHAYNVAAENNAVESNAIGEQLREAQSMRVLSNPGLNAIDTAGRAAKVRTARNEARTQSQFDQRTQTDAGLAAAIQSTKRAEEASKTVRAEQDATFATAKSTDPGLLQLQHRQVEATAQSDRAAVALERAQQANVNTMNAKLDSAASKKEQGALQQQLDQRVTEATSAQGAAELVAQGYDAATVARIQGAQVESAVANSATAAAQRVQQAEFTEAVTSSSGPGSLAEQMAGIDTVHGEALVGAQAIETQRKAYESNVTAYSIQHRDAGVGTDSLLAYAQGSDPANPGRNLTTEEREAAGRAVVDSGNIDAVKPYLEYLSTALNNAAGNPEEISAVQNLQKAFADRIGSSAGKPMGLGPGEIEALRNGAYETPEITLVASGQMTSAQAAASPTLQTANGIQTFNTIVAKGVSAEAWSNMDKNDIGQITQLGKEKVIPPERAATMVESLKTALTDRRINVRIKERERKFLRDLYAELNNGDVSALPANIQNIP